MSSKERLKSLLKTKEKLQKKLQLLNKKFKTEEKENEESWPGHEDNSSLYLEQEYQLIVALLKETEEAIKELQSK